MHMGPRTIPADQFDYSTAIGDAKKQQILANIVKLRYAEWPVFLEVYQVVAGYNWEHTGTAAFSIRRLFDSGESDNAQLGYVGRFVERPTITYSPLGGERFMRSILTPARPEVMLSLIEAGWPADRLFMTMVDSVNGKTNRRFAYETLHPADPAFIRFVQLLKKIHMANAFSMRIRETGENNTTNELHFRPHLLDEGTRRELNDVKALLGLNPDTDTYEVVWGLVSDNPDTIAIKTRSVIQVMAALAVFVELPPEEIAEGGAFGTQLTPKEAEGDLPPLISIQSGRSAPADAFVAVRYHDQSFWIDGDDLNSKLSLAYLTLLLTVNETSDIRGPQLTISTN